MSEKKKTVKLICNLCHGDLYIHYEYPGETLLRCTNKDCENIVPLSMIDRDNLLEVES
jgi:ssDNA-binding Zn-finger/Zn-ribbon topoisomerase 1